MTSDDLQHGDAVFLDANTLIYHFTNHTKFGAACTRLVERIEFQELLGFTSSHCLADVSHRVMTIEAMQRMQWPISRLASRLKQNHTEIPKLCEYQRATARIGQLGIRVLSVSESDVLAATRVCQQFELLTGDGLVVALMQANGISKLASEDDDFDRVLGITRYSAF